MSSLKNLEMDDKDISLKLDLNKSIEDIHRDMLRQKNNNNTRLIIGCIVVLIIMTIIKYRMQKQTMQGVTVLIVTGIVIYIVNNIIKEDVKKAITIFLLGGLAANVYSLIIGGSRNVFTVSFVLLGLSAMYFNAKILIYSSVPLVILMLILAVIAPYSIEGKGGNIAEAVAKVIIYGISIVLMRQAMGVGERYNIVSYEGLQKVRKNKESTLKLANELNTIVEESNVSVGEFVVQSSNISQKSKNIYDEIVKSDNSIETINNSVVSVQKYVERSAEISMELENKYKSILETVTTGVEEVSTAKKIIENMGKEIKNSSNISIQLKKNMEEIDIILEEIDNIFSQTKLLALNSSIEAARAGDKGKGFDVVAEEIKLLSSKSAQASVNVKNIIEVLKNTIEDVIVNVREGAKVSGEGYREMDNITEILQRITDTSVIIEDVINREEKLIGNILQEFDSVTNKVSNISELSKSNMKRIESIRKNIDEQNISVQQLGNKMKNVENVAKDIQ